MVWHSVSRRPAVFPSFLLGAFPAFPVNGAGPSAPKSAGTTPAACQGLSAASAPTGTRALTIRHSRPRRRGWRDGRAVRIPGLLVQDGGCTRLLIDPDRREPLSVRNSIRAKMTPRSRRPTLTSK